MDNANPNVCIVTGAARGIGAAIALAAGRCGYSVCINYREADDAAGAVQRSIESSGGRAIACRADISRADDVARLFETVDRLLGPVAALVNNAGVSGGRHPIADIDSEAFRFVVDVNLLGSFLCIKEAAMRMATSRGGHGGSIVNLSSTAVRTGGMRLAPYVAAKAGVEGLTRALAKELGSDGIRINAVAPGLIATNQHPLDDPAWQSRAASTVPLGRIGTGEEVAEAVLWLLSDAAAYVTGTVLEVAGGR